jgi:hypothetical protein
MHYLHNEKGNLSLSKISQFEARIRSQLAGLSSQHAPMDKEAVKAEGWRDLGILVIDVNHKGLTNAERVTIESIGHRIYGGRRV